ncbi:MAG: phage holin family protein [Deltaproteobacteria bacterium]|nr:phage holin family protein [Deltaproteobacteria bacterium]
MKIFVNFLISVAALWIATLVVPGIHIEASIGGFLMVAVVFGLVNAFLRPIARLISLPIRLLTLGLFSFVINALMFMLTDTLAGDALTIEGGLLARLLRAFVASIVVSIASTLIGWIVPGDE